MSTDETTVDGSEPAVVEDEDETAEGESVSELVEEVGRDTAVLAFRRGQLELSDHAPEVRRATRAAAATGVCAVALLTAFVFANWALASALSSPLPGWRAPLVLAAAWVAVGSIVGLVWVRSERISVRGWLENASETETRAQRQEAVEVAEQELRETLERLSNAVADAAQERIAAAILPVAGGMVDVGEGMVDATDDVLEAADEITDAIEEAVPGGVVVNRTVDFALAPGRLGVRVARRVFTLGRNTTDEADGAADETGGPGAP